MCGKFTQMASWQEVVAFSEPVGLTPEDALVTAMPMHYARIIHLNEAGERKNIAARWGFAAKKDSAPDEPKHMHAQAETVDRLWTFADAFATARGILMVHTFNEGEEMPTGRAKQWTVKPKDGAPLALAVILEKWVLDGEPLWTFVQITVPANPLIAQITDRMPAILKPEDWAVWLGEVPATAKEIKAVLKTYDDAGGWDFAPEPTKPRPRKPKDDRQLELF